MDLGQICLNNIAPIFGICFLFLLNFRSKTFDTRHRRLLYAVLAVELVELVAANAEIELSLLPYHLWWRDLCSALGYSARPLILMLVILMLAPPKRTPLQNFLLFTPLVVAVVLGFSVFVTGLAYSYTPDNIFVRGPLGPVPIACVGIYILMLVVLPSQKRLSPYFDTGLLVLIAAYVGISMLVESFLNVQNIGRTAIVYSTIFYFYLLQSAILQRALHAERENASLKEALHEADVARRELIKSRSVTQALGENYDSIFMADLEENSISAVKIELGYEATELFKAVQRGMDFDQAMCAYKDTFIVEDEKEEFAREFNSTNLFKLFEQAPSITRRFHFVLDEGTTSAVEIHAIRLNRYNSKSVVIGLRNVDELEREERERMEMLLAAKMEADRANVVKTGFLHRMSHDMRTPLNGMLGLIEISKTHMDDQQLVESNCSKIETAAKHLLSLVNDVLQTSKLEDGSFEIEHKPLDLSRLTQDISDIVESRAIEAGIAMLYEGEEGMQGHRYVYGSELHLRQIFLNIYGNCIKYNRVDGKVSTKVDVHVQGGKVVYRWEISDTGIGMSQEFLEHIFEPFAQESDDARSTYMGTGLGMPIAKNLIDLMGGSIEVQSEQGVGSTFTVTIPFDPAPEPSQREGEAAEESASIKGLTLLIAEDNELNAEVAQVLLEDAGAKVEFVCNGQQAVDAFAGRRQGAYDAILMDVMMPVMNGLKATEAVRALDRPDALEVPIIAMTANAFKEDEEACLAAGMNAHLAKPLDMPTVKKVIADCVAGRAGAGE